MSFTDILGDAGVAIFFCSLIIFLFLLMGELICGDNFEIEKTIVKLTIIDLVAMVFSLLLLILHTRLA